MGSQVPRLKHTVRIVKTILVRAMSVCRYNPMMSAYSKRDLRTVLPIRPQSEMYLSQPGDLTEKGHHHIM